MKKHILILNACVRGDASRTKQLMEQAVSTLKETHEDWTFETLDLCTMGLNYFDADRLAARDALLAAKDYEAPQFALARQFRDADGIIVAAPFWDLSIPAVLKVYIENISVDGLTFTCDAEGMHGNCKADWLLFLTTRGGIWEGNPMEQGTTYFDALCQFFGIDEFCSVNADGLDIVGMDAESILQAALEETTELCKKL